MADSASHSLKYASLTLVVFSGIGICLFLRVLMSNVLVLPFVLGLWLIAATLYFTKRYKLAISAVVGLGGLYALWMVVISSF
jgi:hypothetical protein